MRYVRCTYTQSNSGSKITKKIPYMQENSQIFDKKIRFLIITRIFDYFSVTGLQGLGFDVCRRFSGAALRVNAT